RPGDHRDFHLHLDLERLLLATDLPHLERELHGFPGPAQLPRCLVDLELGRHVRDVGCFVDSTVRNLPARSALPAAGHRYHRHQVMARLPQTARTRYALIGAGSRARMYIDAIAGPHADIAELVAWSDTNVGRLDHYEEMLAGLGLAA